MEIRYVSSNDIPADLSSRGLKSKTFSRYRQCISGPYFLWQPKSDWPPQSKLLGKVIAGVGGVLFL